MAESKRKRNEPATNLAVPIDGAPYNKRARPNSSSAGPQHRDSSRSPSKYSSTPRANLDFNNDEARPDPTYGQKSAFPGLDNEAELSDTSDNDALRYLKTVRSEARGIPNLLVAPKLEVEDGEFDESMYDTGHGDFRGYYSDGAYVAAPTVGAAQPASIGASHVNGASINDEGTDPHYAISPRSAYRTRLTSLFRAQRAQLQNSPSAAAVAALSADQYITLSQRNTAASRAWRRALQTTNPSPVQLASMDGGSTLRLLKLARTLLKRGHNIDKRLSRWIWGLLSKLQDVGTLGNEEVCIVRDLGKRAVWVKCGFIEAYAEQTEGFGGTREEEDPEDVEDRIEAGGEEKTGTPVNGGLDRDKVDPETSPDHLGGHEDAGAEPDLINTSGDFLPSTPLQKVVPPPGASNVTEPEPGEDVLEAAKSRILKSISSPVREEQVNLLPDHNTRATLDMIISIAGEFYGQRDLLEFRDDWGDDGSDGMG